MASKITCKGQKIQVDSADQLFETYLRFFMSFFIKDALAAADSTVTTVADAANTTGAATSGTDGSFSIIMMVAMVVIFYLLLWRPQSKRAKEHRNLVSNLQKGDEVVTSGGMLGAITQVDEKFIVIKVSEGVEIKLQRSAISSVLPKGTMKSA